jgi:selenocysteine-specific elongation factor
LTSLVVGVIGHVDHGKSALVRALTGVDTDRLPEEKQRGISIALGFAHFNIADTQIDLIDMPGHERFVRTMVAGATGVDAVLLVVAANEGIQPQTIEHVDIAGLLGVSNAIVAVTKIDLVPTAQAERIAQSAHALLGSRGLKCVKSVLTSAREQRGLDELTQAFELLAAHEQPHAGEAPAFLPIDRAFSIAGHGPVVTGTLRGAAVRSGDTLELLPPRRTVRVRAAQIHGANVAVAEPGQRVALNLRDIEVGDLERGMALAAPGSIAISDWLTITIRAVEDARPLTNGMRVRVLLGTSEVDARLRLLDRDVLEAGARAFAQLHCSESVASPTREHVVLRLPSPSVTVAGGKLLETGVRRHRRNDPQLLQRLEDVSSLPTGAMLASEIGRAGRAGTTLQHLSRLAALSAERLRGLLADQSFVITPAAIVVRRTDLADVCERIPLILRAHEALSRDKLLAEISGTSPLVLEEALRRLSASGAIVERGRQFLLPRPDEDRARAEEEADLAARIAELLRVAGLAPPNPGSIVTSGPAKRAVDRLLRERVVVRAVDRAKGREILFHREAIEEARRRLAPLLINPPGLLVTEIGAALGISRKYCMPLLDHLDSVHFTRRVDDRRVRGSA